MEHDGGTPVRSVGPAIYQSYKGTDGVEHEQGDGESAAFVFAWRTADADGFPPRHGGEIYPLTGPGPED